MINKILSYRKNKMFIGEWRDSLYSFVSLVRINSIIDL